MPKIPRITVVFDFDGTLGETLLTGVDILNGYADEFGFRRAERSEIEGLRGKTFLEITKIFHIPLIKVPFILGKVKKDLLRSIEQIKMVAGVKTVLAEIRQAGFGVGLLSSNSQENLEKFCAHNELTFDFIYAGGSIFGKERVIAKMLKREKLAVQNILYVGDEVRDVEAARKAGVKIVSVSWGFNSREILEKAQPDFLIDQPAELMAVVHALAVR